MLTLTREEGEQIVLYDKESGEILAIVELRDGRAGAARIGVHAPEHIGVDRMEIYARRPKQGAP